MDAGERCAVANPLTLGVCFWFVRRLPLQASQGVFRGQLGSEGHVSSPASGLQQLQEQHQHQAAIAGLQLLLQLLQRTTVGVCSLQLLSLITAPAS